MKYDKDIYNYYTRKYKEEIIENKVIITIPIMDGCSSLDINFINVKKQEGFQYKESMLLKEIYLIKEISN